MMCTDPKKVALNRRSPEPMSPLNLNSEHGEVPLKKRWPRKKNGASVVHRVELLEAQYNFTKFLVEEKIPSMDVIIMQQDAMINQMYHEMQRMCHMLHCMAVSYTHLTLPTKA